MLTRDQAKRYEQFLTTLSPHLRESYYSYFGGLAHFSVPIALFLVEENHKVPCELSVNAVNTLAQKYGFQYPDGDRVLCSINESYALQTDLVSPILYAAYTFRGAERSTMLDGHHRLFRLYKEQRPGLVYVFGDREIDLISPSIREIEAIKVK